MKYNYKLTFNNTLDIVNFAVALFNYVSQRKDWFNNYDCMRRKNILYVYTHNYTCIELFINHNKSHYNYTIIKL